MAYELMFQDPIERQCNEEQVLATGPEVLPILQFPRTASSGRRLIANTLGGSYGFLGPGVLNCSLMQFSVTRRSTTTASSSRTSLIKDQKWRFRLGPVFDVCFRGTDSFRGGAHAIMLSATGTKLAIAVPWDLNPQA
jgi:hypothetical protein